MTFAVTIATERKWLRRLRCRIEAGNLNFTEEPVTIAQTELEEDHMGIIRRTTG